jgi:hypothetical protein
MISVTSEMTDLENIAFAYLPVVYLLAALKGGKL